jgi:sugar lactone lactonase YvrE
VGVLIVGCLALASLIAAGTSASAASPRAAGGLFPDTIALPNGWQPEGIATGPGPFAYFGSLADGSIYRADLRTGRGSVISRGPGTPSVGLKTDARGRLFVAGGAAGDARVIDTRTGRVLASFTLATGESFINDVVLTPDAAWFTDSVNPFLYKLPLGRDGRLPRAATAVPITGDLVYQEGFNVNGIARTPDGKGLLLVQSNTASLFRANTKGATTRVDLGGESLTNGDGLLLCDRTLFVVQNRLNMVAVVRMNNAGTSGRVVERRGDPRFDVPTTVAAFGERLYLPNARFGTTPEPTTPYNAVAIPK